MHLGATARAGHMRGLQGCDSNDACAHELVALVFIGPAERPRGSSVIASSPAAQLTQCLCKPNLGPLVFLPQSPVSQVGRRGYANGYCYGGGYGPHGLQGRPRGRPLSVVSSMGSYSAGCSPATPRHSAVLPPPPPEFLLPDICEFNPGGAPAIPAASAQYASSSGKTRIHLHEH